MPFWRCIQIKGKEKSGNNVLNVNYNKHWELCLFSSFLDTVCVEISSFKYIRKLQEKDHSCVLPAFWALCYKICFLSFHFKIISMNAFNINILLRCFFFFLSLPFSFYSRLVMFSGLSSFVIFFTVFLIVFYLLNRVAHLELYLTRFFLPALSSFQEIR